MARDTQGVEHTLEVSESEVAEVLSSICPEHNGSISFAKFSEWYTRSEMRYQHEFDAYIKAAGIGNELSVTQVYTLVQEISKSIGGANLVNVDNMLTELGVTKDVRESQGAIPLSALRDYYFKSADIQDKWNKKVNGLIKEAKAEEGTMDLSWPDTTRAQIIYVLIFPLMFLFWLTMPQTRAGSKEKYYVVTFVGSLLWIMATTYLMVWWATLVGDVVGIPSKIMGLTILAAGTSVPDLLSSYVVARQGKGDMAVSSSIGSNIFDILIGLPGKPKRYVGAISHYA